MCNDLSAVERGTTEVGRVKLGIPLTNRRAAWIQPAILGILLLARLGFAGLVAARPHLAIANDSDRYVPIANAIVNGEAYAWNTERPGELLNTVGYPLFLALVFVTLGHEAADIALAQLLLTGLAAVLTYTILSRWLGSTPAFVSALILMLEPLAILWSMTILTESLFAVLLGTGFVTLAAWSFSGRRWWLVLAGTFMALASLVRPVGTALVALCAAATLVHPQHEPDGRRTSLRSRAQPVVLFMLPSIVLLTPWIVRNALLWDCPALASFDGVAMRDFHAAKIIVETEHVELEEAQARLRATDPGNCPREKQKYWEMIADHPVTYLRLQVAGTVPVLIGTSFDRWLQYFGATSELPDLWRPTMDDGLGGLLNVIAAELRTRPQGLGLMFALTALQIAMYVMATCGAVAAWRIRSPWHTWIAATIVVSLLAMALIPGPSGHERFRVPMEPLLAILIGFWFAWGNRHSAFHDMCAARMMGAR